MKAILTIIFIAIVSVGYGQKADTLKGTSTKYGIPLGFGTSDFYSKYSLSIINLQYNKTILRIAPFIYNTTGSIDSITVFVRKSKLKWLNDSTAVITK